MQTGGFTLRELERKAKQDKAGIWEGYVPPASTAQARSDAFKGPVVEVVSGDCLVVRDAAGTERRLHLSSIRAPRLGRRGEVPEAWALEAKEHLRSRCVCNVCDDDVFLLMCGDVARAADVWSNVAETAALTGALARLWTWRWSTPARTPLLLVASRGWSAPLPASRSRTKTLRYEERNQCQHMACCLHSAVLMLAHNIRLPQLGLLAAGLVTTVKHRSDDARAAQYAALVEAEEKAKQERKGLHGAKPPPAPRINDLSTSSDGNRGGNAARYG